jgi:hypothetical protein
MIINMPLVVWGWIVKHPVATFLGFLSRENLARIINKQIELHLSNYLR